MPLSARELEGLVADGVIDVPTADRIRAAQLRHTPARRWPATLAIALGGVVLAAGLLLFVASHWDTMSTGARFALIVGVLAALHLAAVQAAPSSPALASTLHAVGTAALGAGIFLSGQIFNLREHWPGGVLLWALGALAGWWLLRDWAQAALLGVLAPAWLAAEWYVAAHGPGVSLHGRQDAVLQGLLLVALVYLGAERHRDDGAARSALVWIGGLVVLPLALAVVIAGDQFGAGAWTLALYAVPLALAVALRGRDAWPALAAAGWVFGFSALADLTRAHELGIYVWGAIGGAALAAWGLRDHARARINLGVAAFMLALTGFYFSSVMDKLGRSLGLIGLGLVLLGGGWVVERGRRRLLARLETP